jgi:hypothetical protein
MLALDGFYLALTLRNEFLLRDSWKWAIGAEIFPSAPLLKERLWISLLSADSDPMLAQSHIKR